MSIIYDALQKTQNNLENTGDKPIKLKLKPNIPGKIFRKLLSAIAVIILFGLISFAMSYYFNHRAIVAAAKQQNGSQDPTHTRQLSLQLTGVFLSDATKLAMINNHLYSIGDKIAGMQIASIESNSVKLSDNTQSLLLTIH